MALHIASPLARDRERGWLLLRYGLTYSRLLGNLFVFVVLSAIALSMAETNVIAAELSIPKVTVRQGDSVTVSIDYRAKQEAIAGIQFELEYDQTIFEITAAAGNGTINSNALFEYAFSEGRIKFAIAVSEPIAEGSLVDLTIQAYPGSRLAPYRLEIVNALGADPSAQEVSVKTKFGLVVVIPEK